MNFTINRSAFISQLNNVLRAISSKTTIPILTGLKMVVNEDNIVLTGSNSDITIESVINANDADNDLTIEDTALLYYQPASSVILLKSCQTKSNH